MVESKLSLESLMDNFTGIVPLVFEAQNEPTDPNVFVIATDIADTSVYGFNSKIVSSGSGAGLNYQNALMAAIGESIERYALSIIHPEDLILGSYHDLVSQFPYIVGPDQWSLYDKKQTLQLPYTVFNKDTKISWVHAENLTYKKDELIPACMVYIPYIRNFVDQGERIITSAISTGTACADSKSEALLKGICEIIERDAFMIMWRNRLSLPKIYVDSNSNLYETFKEKFCRPGLEYTIVYTTLDLVIPSFFGIVIDKRYNPPSIIVGGAAHPNSSYALLKTLLELAQGIKWKDHVKNKYFKPTKNFDNVKSFEDRSLLYASNDMYDAFDFIWNGSQELHLSDIASLDVNDIKVNLKNCINILKKHKLEAIALDLTPIDAYECGLFVTKVFIPGAEVMEGDHTMPCLGGTRWKNVPYNLGLLSNIPNTKSINPYPHPYP